MNEEEGDVSE